jgi:YHS domain-containing protein
MKQNLKNGIAAQGYDVVSFFNGKPLKGNESFTSDYNSAKYLFSSFENKEKFETSPEAYTPQYGGYCPVAMSQNKEVRPNPQSWEIRDGKLYFFTRMLFGLIDGKRQWIKDPVTKQNLADSAWNKMNED